MATTKRPPGSSKEKSDGKSSRPADRFGSLQSALSHVSNNGSKYQFDALVAIRKKFIQDGTGVSNFRQGGGIAKLLTVLESHETSNKMKDVALSILGNCCMDAKCRKEVLWKDGIPIICEVLTTTEVESIQNRACRTLGNLSIDAECCSIVHQQDDLLLSIVEIFMKATESDTKLTFARTIRLLGDTASHQKAVVASEGIKPLGDLLKSEEESIITAGMKGITEFTKTIDSSIARQLIAAEVPASLLKLVTHSKLPIATTAESLIMNYIKSEELRPAIGGAGGIKYFMEGVSNTELVNKKRLQMANALCLCCHDSVNRFRIRSQEGLDLLMEVLSKEEFYLIHNRVISSLVCFMYDDASLDIFLENGLIKQLIHHLRRVAKLGPETKEAEDFLINRKIHETTLCYSQENVAADPHNTDADVTTSETQDDCVPDPEDIDKYSSNTSAFESETNSPEKVEDLLLLEDSEETNKASEQCSKEMERTEEQCKKKDSEESAHSTGDSRLLVQELKQEPSTSATQSCTLKESHSEPILSQSSKPVKYSIDSPTYKEVAEWTFEEQYRGPTNIHDSANYDWAHSPEIILPSQSPPRTSPYSPLSTGSADWSPDHSPIHSPSGKDSLRSFSPVCSPDSSPLHLPYTADSPPLMPAQSPKWSPTLVHNSPVYSSSPESSPVRDQSATWWCPPALDEAALQYSSDEEPDEKSSNKATEASSTPASCPTTHIVDTVPTSVATDASLEGLPVFADVTSVESKAVEIKRKLVNRRESTKQKKKQNESPVTKLKILKAVESSSSSSVDLNKMISEMPETPESSQDHRQEKLQFAKDPRKVTEHNILIILSRISYLDNPGKYFITIPMWMCLLDYIRKARKPLPRAERILLRLVKNPLCFESITELMIPFLISYHLSDLGNYSKKKAEETTVKSYDTNLKESSDSSAIRKVNFTVGGEDVDVGRQSSSENLLTTVVSESSDTPNIKHQKDQLLNCLTLVTETQYGQGVLAHILMKKSAKLRQRCAISLAYICRSKAQRKKMYMSLNGLKWLFEAAYSDDLVIQTKAFMSLLQLGKELKESLPKKDPREDSKRRLVDTLSEVLHHKEQRALDVSFKLPDGKVVQGHRATLAAGCEVFAAMLQGHYSESNLHVIEISDTSETSFQVLVNYLHITGGQLGKSTFVLDDDGDSQPKRKRMATESSNVIITTDNDKTVTPGNDQSISSSGLLGNSSGSYQRGEKQEPNLDSLIELLGLADRYMLEELQRLVADHITTHHLSAENVLQNCQFALLYNCKRLAENCLAFVLFGQLSVWQRLAFLTQVFKSDNKTIFYFLKDLVTKHVSH